MRNILDDYGFRREPTLFYYFYWLSLWEWSVYVIEPGIEHENTSESYDTSEFFKKSRGAVTIVTLLPVTVTHGHVHNGPG